MLMSIMSNSCLAQTDNYTEPFDYDLTTDKSLDTNLTSSRVTGLLVDNLQSNGSKLGA